MSANIGREGETVEFKRSTGELKNSLQSISAMLNRSRRGTVFFGVLDDGTVVGQDITDSTLREISERISQAIEPRIYPRIDVLDDDGMRYIRVAFEGKDTPYAANSIVYIRVADQDRKASMAEVRKLFFRGDVDALRDSCAMRRTEFTFSTLLNMLNSKGYHDRESPEFRRNRALVNDDDEVSLQGELLSDQSLASIKLIRYRGRDRTVMLERKEFGMCSLLVAQQKMADYLQMIDEVRVDLSTSPRTETSLFDFESASEAWKNAVVHNNWKNLVPPVVSLFDDRLEIVSSGSLPSDMTTEEFFNGRSEPVNPSLFDVFSKLGIVEQAGHGVSTIAARYGREAFRITPSTVTVVIPFAFTPKFAIDSGTTDRLTRNQKAFLSAVQSNPKVTIRRVCEITGMGYGTANNVVSSLKRKGLLTRDGSKKSGTWVVNRFARVKIQFKI